MPVLTQEELKKCIVTSERLFAPNFSVEQGELPPKLLEELEAARAADLHKRGIVEPKQKKSRRAAKPVSQWKSENHFLSAVVKRCRKLADVDVRYGYIHHSINEAHRHWSGALPGFPDCFWPIVVTSRESKLLYAGLFVELKLITGSLSVEQQNLHLFLKQQGYLVHTVVEEVEHVIEHAAAYFKLVDENLPQRIDFDDIGDDKNRDSPWE